MAAAFENCAEEDRREEDDRGGVMPPTPCKEFIEIFRCKDVGVPDLECVLIELGDRWRGLLGGGSLPFGDEDELLRWLKARAGDKG